MIMNFLMIILIQIITSTILILVICCIDIMTTPPHPHDLAFQEIRNMIKESDFSQKVNLEYKPLDKLKVTNNRISNAISKQISDAISEEISNAIYKEHSDAIAKAIDDQLFE